MTFAELESEKLRRIMSDPVSAEQLKAITDLIASAPTPEARAERLIAIRGMSNIMLKKHNEKN